MKRAQNVSKKYYLRQITASFLSIWLLFGPSIVMADVNPLPGTLPMGPATPYGGVGRFDYDLNPINPRLDIQNVADGAVINWANFDIGTGATTQFHQVTNSAAVLNRILDGSPTGIMGSLQANGSVFIVNPAGIVFGQGAMVDVAQLVASSLDIDDFDFINGDHDFHDFVVPGVGEVTNLGSITATAGGVALLGRRVTNAGTIITQPGGFVAMAAGDRVLLGQPGSNVIVEMSSATGAGPGVGDVINTGTIQSPGGEIVLAAGDMFSLAGGDLRTVKVHLGTGQVTQNGTINASAASAGQNGGTVSLTSGDRTSLGATSVTRANAGTGGDSGLVTVHSYDTVAVASGAQIQATGGYTPEQVEDDDAPLYLVQDDSVEIIADTISLAGSIDATPLAAGKKGKIHIEADSLTVVDELPAPPASIANMLTEEFIQNQSNARVDLDLVAHSRNNGTITVEGLADAFIKGGAGDITLRTLFDTGGISFLPNGDGDLTTIQTTFGGNIFMSAGAGGITTGDLVTDDTSDSSHTINAGRIRVFTVNGGDITTGTMFTEGGNVTEISAISAGELTVNGGVVSMNGSVPAAEKEVAFARICLVANGNITVDTTQDGASPTNWTNSEKRIVVDAHGKIETTADIRICAGGDLTLTLSPNPGAPISASAQSSQETNLYQSAHASVLIGAGHDGTPGAAVITLNSDTDPENFEIDVDTSISAEGALHTDPQDPLWHKIVVEPPSGGDQGYRHEVQLVINPDVQDNSICGDCPKPPQVILQVVANGDSALEHMNKLVKTLVGGQATVLWNDEGDTLQIIGSTQPVDSFTGLPVGTLVVNANGTFSYTPEPGYTGTAEFDYTIIDLASGIVDDATVTIDMTNARPVAEDGSASGHMNIALDGSLVFSDTPDSLAHGETDEPLTVVVTSDPTHGTVVFDPVAKTFTYTPDPLDPGYVGPDTFTYSVSDGEQDAPLDTGTVTITLTNARPVAEDGSASGHMNIALDGSLVFSDTPDGLAHGETDEPLTVVVTANPTHGTVVFNPATGEFTYTPTDPGYVGTDTFTYSVSDGQQGAAPVGATVTITLTNTPPSGSGDLGTVHMDQVDVQIQVGVANPVSVSDVDGVDVLSIDTGTYTGSNGGTLEFNGASWTYTPNPGTPGYVGDPGGLPDETFTITIWDGEMNYSGGDEPTRVTSAAQVVVELDNVLPGGSGDLGQTPVSTVLVQFQTDVTNPLTVEDLIDQSDGYNDTLSIVKGIYAGNNGGTLQFDGANWTYTPASGFVGAEQFNVDVWDGQMDYSGRPPTMVFGSATVTVLVSGPGPGPGPEPKPEPLLPPAPLPELEEPEIEGCPVLMDAVAMELGIASETIQLSINRALAAAPNIQPCDACARFIKHAGILSDPNGIRMAAMVQIFNEIAPANMPPSDEMFASIATAFRQQLDNADMPQYATAMEFLDAFVGYIAVLNTELGSPVGDSTVYAMAKHGGPTMTGNSNIAAYIQARLQSAGR